MMPCATCGAPFAVRRKDHRFCSAKCRLSGFQQKHEHERRERDAKVRLLLGEALRLLSQHEGRDAEEVKGRNP
jgi:predicted nucleic acid-binding Zn ribbon protein